MTGWSTAAAKAAYDAFREFAVAGSSGDRIDVQLSSEFFNDDLQAHDLRVYSLQAQQLMSPEASVHIGNTGMAPPLRLTEGGASTASHEDAGGQ